MGFFIAPTHSLLYIAPLVSFIITFLATPILIRYLRRLGLEVPDQNKIDKPLIPISGGLAVLAGILAGLMTYAFILIFYYQTDRSLVFIFAATLTIILITFIGFLDDIIINKGREASSGLRQWQKTLLTLFPAAPLIVINAGVSVIFIPFIGPVDFGILYPLLLIPIGVVGASNMVNLLGGLNGIETGMGLVYTGMLSIYAYTLQEFATAALGAIAFMALLAFLYYNKYPAKIFPGDSLTYLLGSVIVSMAILGNIEKAALIASIPFIMEFILKLRSKLKAQCYGIYQNGKIHSLYGRKIYSLVHIFTRTGRFTEKQIFYIFILIELFFSSIIWIV